MTLKFSVRVFLSLIALVFIANSASAQSEWQALVEKYSRNAQKVEVAGVEFKGYKSGQTKFTKCNGEVIDIGSQAPKATGPCPQDGNPYHILVFRAILIALDGTILRIKAADGKEYELYLPEEATELVPVQEPDTQALGISGVSESRKDAGVRLMSDAPTAKRNRDSFKITDLRRNQMRPGETITIVSFVNGRADAIIRD
jgi:hypothetical protein